MKIKNKSNRKKIVIAILLILVGVLLLVLIYSKFYVNNDKTYNEPSNDQVEAGNTVKSRNADAEKDQNQTIGSDPKPKSSPTDQPLATPNFSITAANISNDNKVLYIRTVLQEVTSEGTCTLDATGPNGKTYNASAEVQAGPTTSTCKGFNIPVAELSKGNWTFNVKFENNNIQTSASKEVII